ncbi:hypothetical protein J4427_00895 [Candidatus Woesearchaeota archaeon]|nr:hypothetical protein [Candidatus Woesearchaeota archaeon]
MKSNWRYFVEDSVRRHLELQIMEATKHKEAYGNSENPANSQIWVAIANLSKQIFETNLRIKFLEKTISDLINKQISEGISKAKKRK